VAKARWWLVGTTLLTLTGVAGCASPTASPPPSTSSPKVTSHSGVVGPVYSAPKPCSSVVAPGTYSPAELRKTQAQVEQATTGQFLSLGIGASTVEIGLMEGREALAAQIAKTFGPKVSITVGLTSYCGGPGRSPLCSSMPAGNPLPSGLNLNLIVKHRTVKTGEFDSATLVVSEDGPRAFQMDTGQPLVAQVVRPGTRHVVGTYDAGIGGTGYGPRLEPGQVEKIPIVFGTARCDGGLGSAMPTGRYDVVAYMHPETPGPGPVYYAPAVPVDVTGR
jgi:hypothetical protein